MGQPIRLKGSIQSHPIYILINLGFAYNLLYLDIAHQLDLQTEQVDPVHFTTTTHEQVTATRRALNVSVTLQGYTITGSFLLLDIHGYDFILGSAWLEITWVYRVAFQKQNHDLQCAGHDPYTLRLDHCPPTLSNLSLVTTTFPQYPSSHPPHPTHQTITFPTS
ncbi:hypothetical protein EV1_004344 [Malus domestica]